MQRKNTLAAINKKPSIWDAFQEDEWEDVKRISTTSSAGKKRLEMLPSVVGFNTIRMNINSRARQLPKEQANYVNFRIGSDILHELKWKSGDFICVRQSKTSALHFYLVKVDSSMFGYKLSIENKHTSHLNICVRWLPEKVPLNRVKMRYVDFCVLRKEKALMIIADDSITPGDKE